MATRQAEHKAEVKKTRAKKAAAAIAAPEVKKTRRKSLPKEEGPKVPPKVWLRNAAGDDAEKEAKLARKIAKQQMTALMLWERDLSLSIVRDPEIRQLNKEWRQKDKHTDVLTFPLHINVGSLGDIVISIDTARRQAKEGGWTLEKELRRLMAHGLMHALGYDHLKLNDAYRMAAAERRLLGEHGLVGQSLADVNSQRK
jgi:probable rRNA maturation factor